MIFCSVYKDLSTLQGLDRLLFLVLSSYLLYMDYDSYFSAYAPLFFYFYWLSKGVYKPTMITMTLLKLDIVLSSIINHWYLKFLSTIFGKWPYSGSAHPFESRKLTQIASTTSK